MATSATAASAYQIPIPYDEVAAFCRKWLITELTLCGTVLRGDAAPENGVDFLARFDPATRHTLIDLGEMEEELGALLGRETLIGSWEAIERSDNPYRREAAREAAQTVYDAT